LTQHQNTGELPRKYQKEITFLAMAEMLGQLGTCDRKKVGAIIVRDGRCISWGYNGSLPGMPHCSENQHGYPEAMYVDERVGCRNVTHAEANAVAFAARQGISTDGGTLYVTVSPCETCARLIIASGIQRVVYSEEYRDPAGIQLLSKAEISCVG